MTHLSLRRLHALLLKESRQMRRDPSTLLIAFVLPVILLLLFATAVSLDLEEVPIGLVVEGRDARSQSLAAAFEASTSFRVTRAADRRVLAPLVDRGRLRGLIVLPQDFERRLGREEPLVQVLCDGSQPNTAAFVAGYSRGLVERWARAQSPGPPPAIEVLPRFRFNASLDSRRFLLPGAIAIVMTMIGTLLTSLVISREWERGTMEALLSTPALKMEILLGKLLPYFLLGLVATALSAGLAVFGFGVPLLGSWLALLLLAAVFLVPALGQGLLISTLAPNQFLASQIALFTGFLPSFLLSGFLFEIDSMPLPIRLLTTIVPARHFVSSLQTVFLVGDNWQVLLCDMAAMLAIGAVFALLVIRKSRRSLEA